ncbi:MAG TPA: LuxR C-terminal-related transcriptional regulator [Albitalea sp.]|uniref:helix-turn-helix transcriptional regulator n=1 Tax=Piscinibacter sp. TaxID=1903157 RepID=UPI002ED3BCDF
MTNHHPDAAGPDPAESSAPSAPSEVAQLTIAQHDCRLLCVDNMLPRHSAARNGARPRLTYVDREVVHFELGGHSFALVCSEPAASAARGRNEVPEDIRELLTNRELQIVQLICMGCLTKQVADRLHISEFTVRSYLKTVYCKLGVRSRGAMVYRYAQAFKRNGE